MGQFMPCFSPIQGFEKAGMTENGKFGFTHNPKNARRLNGVCVSRIVPCRKCEGCRHDFARHKMTQICHEASMYFNGVSFENSFITLTYNDDNIPAYGALDYFSDWRNFLKRLRVELSPKKIRFFMIGEYGEKNLRPHYHAIIFGHDFPDRQYLDVRHGNILYRSPLLEKCWSVSREDKTHRVKGSSMGYSSLGEVTPASAAYCARYSMKKVIGFDPKSLHREFDPITGVVTIGKYERLHSETGDLIVVPGERHLASNGGGKSGMGGLGKRWFDKYALTDIYVEKDEGVWKDSTHLSNGMLVRPTPYYDKLLDRVRPDLLEAVKQSRQDYRSEHADNFTSERLEAKRKIFLFKTRNLKRELGSG